jgi:hypothetical protein
LEKFGFEKLAQPQSGSNLPFCTNLNSEGGKTCCSAKTVNGFQTKLNTLISDLGKAVGTRDKYLQEIENKYYVIFQGAAKQLKTSFTEDVLNLIKGKNEAFASVISEQVKTLQDLSGSLTEIHDGFMLLLRNYQRSRVPCITNLLKVQTSAWCLACDPNYASLGVATDGSIAYSEDLCDSVSEVCYPFLVASTGFNPLIKARGGSDRAVALAGYVKAIGERKDIPTTVLSNDIFKATKDSQKTVIVPSGCEGEDDCDWQCQNLIPNGVLDINLVANGAGQIGGDELTLPNIDPSITSRLRLLQDDGKWKPDLEGTGLNYNNVVADPGEITQLKGDGGDYEVVPGSNGYRLALGSTIIASLVFVVTMF